MTEKIVIGTAAQDLKKGDFIHLDLRTGLIRKARPTKKTNCCIVNSADLLDKKRNPSLSFSARDIMKNKKIRKKWV